MPKKNRDIKNGNKPPHKHEEYYPKIRGHFLIPTFAANYWGESDKLNIRKTDYYKPKGGQTINLQKEPYFKELIKKIKISVLRLAEHYYKVRPGYRVDVVSMWLNSNEKNMYHPPHNHMNTFMSGVMWLDGKKGEYAPLQFLRPYAIPTLPIISQYNEINSNIVTHPSMKDEVVFFPSYLYHYVGVNKNRKPRLSIAFDTILRGKYGEIIKGGETVGQYKI